MYIPSRFYERTGMEFLIMRNNHGKLKITEVKGRPLPNWIGKKTIDITEIYPAQLVETFNCKTTDINLHYDRLIHDWKNLLFHGDNKEVLCALLQNGFRGKIDLIYIDPPFDSKADYIRKVELRGGGGGGGGS